MVALFSHSAVAQDQRQVDYDQSSLAFVLQSGSNSVTGLFPDWQAEVLLFAGASGVATIAVDVDTTTATTGNPLLDSILHTADWLNSGQHATARFISEDIVEDAKGGFRVSGQLSIKDMAHQITLSISPYVLGRADSTAPVPEVAFVVEGALDRFTYDIGSDFDATTASQQVGIIGKIVFLP